MDTSKLSLAEKKALGVLEELHYSPAELAQIKKKRQKLELERLVKLFGGDTRRSRQIFKSNLLRLMRQNARKSARKQP